VTEKG